MAEQSGGVSYGQPSPRSAEPPPAGMSDRLFVALALATSAGMVRLALALPLVVT